MRDCWCSGARDGRDRQDTPYLGRQALPRSLHHRLHTELFVFTYRHVSIGIDNILFVLPLVCAVAYHWIYTSSLLCNLPLVLAPKRQRNAQHTWTHTRLKDMHGSHASPLRFAPASRETISCKQDSKWSDLLHVLFLTLQRTPLAISISCS